VVTGSNPRGYCFIAKPRFWPEQHKGLFLPATSISGAAFCLAPKMSLMSQIFTFLSHRSIKNNNFSAFFMQFNIFLLILPPN